MSKLLSDFKAGPLDLYRKRASFDWKKLKVFLNSEEIIQYQNEFYEFLQDHPAFQKTASNYDVNEERRLTSRQAFALKSCKYLSQEYTLKDYRHSAESTRLLISFAPSAYIKYSVGANLFNTVIMSMGTYRHFQFYQDSQDGKIFGSYALTEIAHGSNARGMQTVATFDKTTQEFVLNSPSFEAAKCWVGGLGQMATHTVVYAQLILNGRNYGLHIFVAPLRDPKTLLPHAGVTVGDLGEKIGLNGIDNGFVMFHNYRIPRINLLNKVGDVNEQGEYVTRIKDANKRHGASLASLSVGRVNITVMTEALGLKSVAIALRYAAVRRQFGPDESTELPILEYQSHQYRLLPFLAAGYCLRVFGSFLSVQMLESIVNSFTGTAVENAAELGQEIHGLSSASKPLAGWTMKEAVQECRECCGGHGYLKISNLGQIRNDFDANLTYEGENHVLIQQTSNFLLKFWPRIVDNEQISYPLHSVDFLTHTFTILMRKLDAQSVEEICRPQVILSAYQWLVCYLLKRTNEKLEMNLRMGKDSFNAKNDCQVFYAKSLSIAYIQSFILMKMLEKINQSPDESIRKVLSRLFALYGLWTIEKQHLGTFYEGGYIPDRINFSTLVQEAVLRLCAELKDDAIALVDVIAPPDFILNSVLGNSDGQVYKHLEEAILNKDHPRPDWWKEIVNWKDFVKSKL